MSLKRVLLVPLLILALIAPVMAVVPVHQQWDGDGCALTNNGDFTDITNWNPDALPNKPYDTINYAVAKSGACISNPVDNIADPTTGTQFTNWEGMSNIFPSDQLLIIKPDTTGITVGSQNCNSHIGAYGLNVDTQSISFGNGIALDNNGVGTNNVCIDGPATLLTGWYYSYNAGEDRWYLGEDLELGSGMKDSLGNPAMGCSYGTNLANAPGFYSLNNQPGNWDIYTSDVRDCVFEGAGIANTDLTIREDLSTASSRWDITGTEQTLFKDLNLKWQTTNAADWELVVNNTVTLQDSYAYPDFSNLNSDFDIYVGDTLHVINSGYGPSYIDIEGAVLYNNGIARLAGPTPTYEENVGGVGTSDWQNGSEMWWDLGSSGAAGLWTTSPTSIYTGLEKILVFGIANNKLDIYANDIGNYGVTDLVVENAVDIDLTTSDFNGKNLVLEGGDITLANGNIINISGAVNLSAGSSITQTVPGSSLYAGSLNVETDSDADITLDNIAVYGDSVLECGDLTAQYGVLYTGNINVDVCTSMNTPSLYGGVNIDVQNITDFGDLGGGTPGTFSYCELEYTSLPGSWSAGTDDQKLGCSPHVVRSLTSPTFNRTYGDSTLYNFTWSQEYGDLGYQCQIDDTGGTFASPLLDWTTVGTTNTTSEQDLSSLTYNQEYDWRCRSQNEDGAYSPWSSPVETFNYSIATGPCPVTANFTVAKPLNGSIVDIALNGLEIEQGGDTDFSTCNYGWDGVNWLGNFDCADTQTVYDRANGNHTVHLTGIQEDGLYTCTATSDVTITGQLSSGERIEQLKVLLGFLVVSLVLVWFLFKNTRYSMLGDMLGGGIGLIAVYLHPHIITWLICFILLTNLILSFIDKLTYQKW